MRSDKSGHSQHRGACHCGAVTFEVQLPPDLIAYECNCSMCKYLGYLHVIVPDEDFRILSGADKLTSYQFNSGTADHLFCSICGIKNFYRPRSHPEDWSVSLRALDETTFKSIDKKMFDGRHWEESIDALHEQEHH